jgi:hypothetical protein
MGSEEFVFRLPGGAGFKRPDGSLEFDREFPLASINDYDAIFGEAIRNWECNVRRGFILLFQRQHNGRNYDKPLGLMAVEDAKVKFR